MVSGSLKGLDKEKVMHKLFAKVTWKKKDILSCLALLPDNSYFQQETGNWGVKSLKVVKKYLALSVNIVHSIVSKDW